MVIMVVVGGNGDDGNGDDGGGGHKYINFNCSWHAMGKYFTKSWFSSSLLFWIHWHIVLLQTVTQIGTLLQTGDAKEAVKVCKSSLKVYPCSVPLWQQYFKMKLTGTVNDFYMN